MFIYLFFFPFSSGRKVSFGWAGMLWEFFKITITSGFLFFFVSFFFFPFWIFVWKKRLPPSFHCPPSPLSLCLILFYLFSCSFLIKQKFALAFINNNFKAVFFFLNTKFNGKRWLFSDFLFHEIPQTLRLKFGKNSTPPLIMLFILRLFDSFFFGGKLLKFLLI